jgi:hypothetical protein
LKNQFHGKKIKNQTLLTCKVSNTENELIWIQSWFSHQCDEEWEHTYGVTIETLDNPGWSVSIDLKKTELEDKVMQTVSEETSDEDWISCTVTENQFRGFGGTKQLTKILEVFRNWVEQQK